MVHGHSNEAMSGKEKKNVLYESEISRKFPHNFFFFYRILFNFTVVNIQLGLCVA